MTGVGAAVRKAKVAAGSNVAVMGCGAVGLNVLQGAKLVSAGQIIAVDVGRTKLDRAMQFGATHIVDAAQGEVVEQVKALTQGRGVDYVFESAGRAETFRLAVEAVRPGGQVVWLGKININEQVSFRWGSLMGERRIVRSSYGDARPRRDFPWIVHEYLGRSSFRRSRGASSRGSATALPRLPQGRHPHRQVRPRTIQCSCKAESRGGRNGSLCVLCGVDPILVCRS